jgi:hypothetical protein
MRECCVWGSLVRDMLPCAVRFLGRALYSLHWGVISSKNGVGTLSATLSFCLRFGCDYRGGRGCLRHQIWCGKGLVGLSITC